MFRESGIPFARIRGRASPRHCKGRERGLVRKSTITVLRRPRGDSNSADVLGAIAAIPLGFATPRV